MIKLTTYNCVLMCNAFHVVKYYLLLLFICYKHECFYTKHHYLHYAFFIHLTM